MTHVCSRGHPLPNARRLHTIYSRGLTAMLVATEGAVQRPPTPSLGALLSSTAEVLSQSGQELGWLTSHPLWLPTPLSPLFKSLRWRADAAAYLLACLLTDQQVLVHSADPHRLCAQSRKISSPGPRRDPTHRHPFAPAAASPSRPALVLSACAPS